MTPASDIQSGLFELYDTQPDRVVQPAEYHRLLGFPRHHVLEGRTRELAEWAAEWYARNGRPWIYARQAGGIEITDHDVRFDDVAFASSQLISQFRQAGAHDAVLVAVSAGDECEASARELWEEGKPDEYFFLEIFGSAVVEQLIAALSGRVCAWADRQGLAVLPHYSPGYSGWEVSEQRTLWEAIQMHGEAGRALKLEVLESGMLRPKKSLLAVFGLTRHVDRVKARLIPCESCSLASCDYRRVPYAHFRPQIEDMRRLQGLDEPPPEEGSTVAAPLAPDANYSTNRRALQKWARERLELRTLADQSVEARFRYEGTTCSNMGAPLEFHYQVILGPPTSGCRILRAECAPAHNDQGHTRMCEYLNDPATLMGNIANEHPLLGHPLDEILTWDAPLNPSGCYCDAPRRAHKWRLVYEVIHFALAERRRLNPAPKSTSQTPSAP